MKRCIKLVVLTFIMSLFFGMTVQAAPAEGTVFALGADLSESQRATVLGLFGVTEEELAGYTVITITNDVEHQYLDEYIDSSVIGTRSLSCVMVEPQEEGYGVVVTSQNISYCTTGMYRNALLTAGVENAAVTVVGPTEISGTAALIGAIRAFEEISGEEVDDETLDTALDELVSTGEIVTKSATSEEVEELIAYIKGKLAAGELETEEDIRAAIVEAQELFGVTLETDEVEQIVSFMLKIKKLGIDPNFLLDQAADLYDKFGDSLLTKATSEGFFSGLTEIVSNIGQSIINFFKSFLSK